ncbi:MAG: response regulator [Planctomycetota bacterium]
MPDEWLYEEKRMNNLCSVTILLVEDDKGHARLIEKNLRRVGIHNPIIHLDDGQKAVDFLFCRAEYKDKSLPTPLIVLLDLNMPILDGYQVIKQMKTNPLTHRIPVIVLTTTGNAGEVQLCYELGCNVFIKKPVEYHEFCEAIRKLGMFLEIVVIPNGE